MHLMFYDLIDILTLAVMNSYAVRCQL